MLMRCLFVADCSFFNVWGEGGGVGEWGLSFYALPLLSDFKRFYTTTSSLLSSLYL